MLFWRKKPEVFWSWFVDHAEQIGQIARRPDFADMAVSGDWVNRMAEVLKRYDKRLFPLFGVAPDGVAELIVTADGDAAAFPRVFELIGEAPEIPGWRFIALKPRNPSIPGVGVNGRMLMTAGLRCHIHRENGLPNILLLCEEDVTEDFQAYLMMSSILVECLLGEETYATEVGAVAAVTRSRFVATWGHDGNPIETLQTELPPARPH
jgi:hypothetical protein